MQQEIKETKGIETIWSVYEALGGEKRPYHPHFSINEHAEEALEPLNKRPSDKRESWGRPHLGRYTDDIGNMVEDYLEEQYDMERVNNGEVDLRVTDGAFEGVPVQAKGAVLLASQGEDTNGNWYSRPGGIYMREQSMNKLAQGDALLHTVVHYPRTEFTASEREKLVTPIREVYNGSKMEPVESALIGELVLPVEQVMEEVNFNDNGFRYWDWPEAYRERPNTSQLVSDWYRNTFIEEKMMRK